ncbi:hybrid sensor histidine kinase/response regulator transcription factor [Dysgonomonas sp. HGC4]|uniref:hybrid sensor histidine kinase/response regulator transcription factor n=1 Tax=Dysgonomonas sp. HGC4 TaxID=1658009 RepID=UPI000681864D|nr:hybrid sensor histidine kinase/response regulator transcription factor [Dysgonomonas sp. HGC4]MBD8347282.1 response regulator [Dysgonomonas sp. HGC4]
MKTLIKIVFILLISIITRQSSYGGDVYFKHLSIMDGLSQPSAISIWQDRLGNMWFGNNVLNRYNGNGTKIFQVSNFIDNIQDTNIKQICGDSKTVMYALVNNQLISYDYFADKFKDMNIEANYIYILNDILYYAWGNTVFVYDAEHNKSFKLIELPTEIKCFLFSDDLNYWVATSDGIYKVTKENQEKVLSGNSISCLFRDSNNNIWVGTRDNGVWVIKPEGDVIDLRTELSDSTNKTLPLNHIRTINEDNKNNIWIGTYNGVIVFSPLNRSAYLLNHNEVKPYSLRNNSVYSIYKDKQGTMWVGTYYGGVSYFNPDIELYTYYSTSKIDKGMLSGLIIGEMTEDNEGNLFIASEDGGLNILNRRSQSIKRYDTENSLMPHNTLKSLWYDLQKNKLYVGTFTEGLVVYDSNNHHIKRLGQDFLKTIGQRIITQIIPYKEYLLISTQSGIYKLNRNTEEFSDFSSDDVFSTNKLGFIQTMCLDEDNLLWLFSSEKGLLSVDTKTHQVTHFDDIEMILKKNSIIKIKSDEKGKVYFLTNGVGVLVYDKITRKITSYKKEMNDILLSDICYNLAFTHSGRIIITSDKGITLLSPEENKSVHLKIGEIFPLNIMSSSCGLFVSPSDGRIFIGGISGMLSVSEKDILTMTESSKPYRLHFSSLSVNNDIVNSITHPNILMENIAYAKGITLSYEQNNISITFASSDYIHPNNTKYEYILEGYDQQWTKTRDKTIRYTSLPPGKYHLIVRDINDKAQSLRIDLVIKPPFYASVWAYIIYTILSLLLLIYIIRSAQRNMMLRATLKMEHREKVRMEELNQMKTNFFTNISHEFRTPLTLILSHLDMALISENMTAAIRKRLSKIKKHTRNMQDLINELKDLRKSEEGVLTIQIVYRDVCSFVEDIYSSFKDYAQMRNINYSIEYSCERIELWFDPYLLQKVIYNLLSNAFKFTDDSGTITLILIETKTHIEITVKDNGIGISGGDLERIFERFYQVEQVHEIKRMEGMGIGLALCKNIIELHHGEILVDSKPAIGTSFTVRLQLGGAHFEESLKYSKKSNRDDIPLLPSVEMEDNNEFIVDGNLGDNSKTTILIIEDNGDLLHLLVEAFSPIYKVLIATNGEEGLSKAREHMPDIILTDIMIPRFSGLEICKQLKSHIETSHIPIILITALASLEQNIEGLKQGADDYITKPFDLEILLLKCNNLVRSRKALQYKFRDEQSFETVGLATNIQDQKILDKSILYIEDNLTNENFDISQWAKELQMGRTKLFNKIKGITGLTPNDFIINIKMKKAALLLKNNPDMTVAEIAYQLGFASPGYFSKCFKEIYGITPVNYRNN